MQTSTLDANKINESAYSCLVYPFSRAFARILQGNAYERRSLCTFKGFAHPIPRRRLLAFQKLKLKCPREFISASLAMLLHQKIREVVATEARHTVGKHLLFPTTCWRCHAPAFCVFIVLFAGRTFTFDAYVNWLTSQTNGLQLREAFKMAF